MLAAVVEKPGNLVIKDVPKPTATGDSLVIKVEAASICNATDNHIVEGIFDGGHDHYPQILGHEVCGTVVEKGETCSRAEIGQRIALYTSNGAFAEYVEVPGWANFAVVPDSMDSETAALCETFNGSYESMVAPAELTWGDVVLVIGAGPLGLATIGTAAMEAKTVCAVDFYENRLAMARELGAAFTYKRGEMSVQEILEALQRDVGDVDVTFMCIALDKSPELDAFHLAIEATRYNGRIAGLNVEVKLEHHNHRMNPFHMNRKNIKYRHMLERDSRCEDFQKAYDLVGKGKIPMGRTITHRVTLDQLPWALEMTHSHLDECIKIIVYPRLGEK